MSKPWEVVDALGTEAFALRFELDAMLRMGNSLNDVLFSYAWDGVTYTIVSRTLLGALYAGLWPLGLVKVASVLDNPFSVALARADKAGKVLAHALIDGVQGKRPVTLMGYSIGARVIYSCLIELAEQHAFGLVESVVLMGAPAPSDSKSWRLIRSVVADRVVNVYSTEDYILGFLYRSTKLAFGVAGLQDVEGVYGIENADMSKLVNGHDKYRYLVGTILTKIGFGDVDFNKVAEQERALELAERKKQQVREHVKKHKKESHQSDPSAQGATEMVVVPGRSNTSPPTPSPNQNTSEQAPLRRPMISQSRSAQQPQMRRQMTMPSPAPERQQLSRNTLSEDTDPLSGAIKTQDLLSNAPRQSTFPIASRSHQRQTPSNMVPTAAAPRQRTNFTEPTSSDEEEEYKITMRDLESQKVSPPLEGMLKNPLGLPPSLDTTVTPKSVPAVVVTEVAGHDDDSSDDEEVSSEFGELSMVEPLPMDDNDFGLM